MPPFSRLQESSGVFEEWNSGCPYLQSSTIPKTAPNRQSLFYRATNFSSRNYENKNLQLGLRPNLLLFILLSLVHFILNCFLCIVADLKERSEKYTSLINSPYISYLQQLLKKHDDLWRMLPTLTILWFYGLELELLHLCFQIKMEVKPFFFFYYVQCRKKKAISAQFFQCKLCKHFSSGNDPLCGFQADGGISLQTWISQLNTKICVLLLYSKILPQLFPGNV